MAWARTLLALVVVSALFLRWLPQHGTAVLVLFGLAVVTAGAIYLTQRSRYARSARGIDQERSDPGAGPVLGTSTAVVVLAALGIWVVLT